MKIKKTLTVCLLLVMTLQLLPINQAIRYFLIDNVMIEEIVDINETATKNFRLLDDHNFLYDIELYPPRIVGSSTKRLLYYEEMLPPTHPFDIHTPPPNGYYILPA